MNYLRTHAGKVCHLSLEPMRKRRNWSVIGEVLFVLAVVGVAIAAVWL